MIIVGFSSYKQRWVAMGKNDSANLELKAQAGEEAVLHYVRSGMVVGLGAGSTSAEAIKVIGRLLKEGKLRDIVGIPCGVKVEALARSLDIPVGTLEDYPKIEVTIDGADEVDPDLNLIKGGGGALLREKMVAQATEREIIIVDSSKLSQRLGTHWPVPIEVIEFSWRATQRYLESLGAKVEPRTNADGSLFHTDQGNLILDANFGPIENPAELALALQARAGIVEHGLFLDITFELIVAEAGGIRHVKKPV